jgi:hypothetical protein
LFDGSLSIPPDAQQVELTTLNISSRRIEMNFTDYRVYQDLESYPEF